MRGKPSHSSHPYLSTIMQLLAPLFFAAAATSSVRAQDDYLTGLGNLLRDAGLTQVAELAGTVPGLQDILESGGNKTILAPQDAAVNAVPESQRSQIAITYHIINSTVERDDIEDDEHLIRSTLLSDIDFVQLGGRPQVVSLSELNNGSAYVSLARANVTFVGNNDDDDDGNNTLRYRNLVIHRINGVLLPPAGLNETASQAGVTAALDLIRSADLLEPLEQSTRGFTLFVPSNAAIEAAQANISAVAAQEQVNVLLNHAVNGTVLYSSQLPDDDDNDDNDNTQRITNAVTATGNNLTFSSRDDSLYVRSGEIEARIIRSDVLYSGGVVHVIDQVLLNTTVNQEAADDAAEETPSGPLPGETGGNTGGNTGTGGSDGALASGVAMSTIALAALGSACYVLF